MYRFSHEHLNRAMRKFGWIATGVPGKAIYTVGLMTLFKHPEVMVHAMAADQSKGVIDRAVELLREGQRLEPGISDEIAEGYPAKIIDVHPSNFPDWMGQAFGYYGAALQVRQIVWCDSQKRFPGDPQYEHRYRMQKLFDVRRPEYDDPIPGAFECNCAGCAEARARRAMLN